MFFDYFISLDISLLSVNDCLLLIAESAFHVPPSEPDSNPSPSSSSASSDSAAIATTAPISQSSFQVILLGVDEISKSKCEQELLTLLGQISDKRIRRRIIVIPIVTSLSQRLVYEGLTGTDRVVNFIPLPAYLPGAAEMLMLKLGLHPNFGPMIKAICRSLGNHGRMLEVLHDILNPTSTNSLFRALQASMARDEGNAVDSILRAVVANGGMHFFRDLIDLSTSLIVPVCCALLGQTISRSIFLPGCPKTPDQLQAQGIFIGDAESIPGSITPIMSHFQVIIWAETVRRQPSQSPALHALANSLVEILSLKYPLSGFKFETFHAGMHLYL